MEDTQTAMQHDKESQERQIRLAIYQEVVRNNDAQSLSQVLAQCEAVEEWVLLGNEPDTQNYEQKHALARDQLRKKLKSGQSRPEPIRDEFTFKRI